MRDKQKPIRWGCKKLTGWQKNQKRYSLGKKCTVYIYKTSECSSWGTFAAKVVIMETGVDEQLESPLLQLPFEVLKLIMSLLHVVAKSAMLQTCQKVYSLKNDLFLPFVPYTRLSKELQSIYGMSSFPSFLCPRENADKLLLPEAKVLLFGAKVDGVFMSPFTRSLVLTFSDGGASVYYMGPRRHQHDFNHPLFSTDMTIRSVSFSEDTPTERVALIGNKKLLIIDGFHDFVEDEIALNSYELHFELPKVNHPRFVRTGFQDGSNFFAPYSNGLLKFTFDIDIETRAVIDVELRTILFATLKMPNKPRYFFFFRRKLGLMSESEIKMSGSEVVKFDGGLDMGTGNYPLSDRVIKIMHDKHCLFIVAEKFDAEESKYVLIYDMSTWTHFKTIDFHADYTLFSTRFFYTMKNGSIWRKDIFNPEIELELQMNTPNLIIWMDPFMVAMKFEKYVSLYNFANPQHFPYEKHPTRYTVSNATPLRIQF